MFITPGTFEVPIQLCADSYQAAIARFDSNPPANSQLKFILFVDTNVERIRGILQDFKGIVSKCNS